MLLIPLLPSLNSIRLPAAIVRGARHWRQDFSGRNPRNWNAGHDFTVKAPARSQRYGTPTISSSIARVAKGLFQLLGLGYLDEGDHDSVDHIIQAAVRQDTDSEPSLVG